MAAWLRPMRGTCRPAYICMYIWWPSHSAVASNIDTSTVAPSPVRSRRNRAASTDWVA